MIYINYDGPQSPMLHTKFRRFKRRRFFIVFTIYGHGGHLGHVTWAIYINFRFPFLRMFHMKFGFDWPSGFRVEDLEIVDRRLTDDGAWPSYKLTF